MDELLKQEAELIEAIKSIDKQIDQLKASQRFKQKHLKLVQEEISSLNANTTINEDITKS
jgi:prefoldin subunit 5